MFGYIKPEKDELKVKEYDQYKGIYCSLCKTLKKTYGLPAGLILSYDFTFVAMLGMALEGSCPGFKKGRCAYNPAKRCSFCTGGNNYFDAVAALSVILFYYKLKDNIADGGFPQRLLCRAAMTVAHFQRKKAARLYPQIDYAAGRMMDDQQAAEADGELCLPDEAADPTAHMVAFIAAYLANDPQKKSILERFGYHIGRWIYFIDAADDLKKDLKKGNFNPIANKFALDRRDADDPAVLARARDYANGLLNMSLSQAIIEFERLDIKLFAPILHNVLHLGMAASQEKVYKGKENDDDRQSL
ncbi:MAG: hypothetical protein IJL87_07240 [Clostridia bacterium]|nr:hypothetical protein [Clostridia bacterium]